MRRYCDRCGAQLSDDCRCGPPRLEVGVRNPEPFAEGLWRPRFVLRYRAPYAQSGWVEVAGLPGRNPRPRL